MFLYPNNLWQIYVQILLSFYFSRRIRDDIGHKHKLSGEKSTPSKPNLLLFSFSDSKNVVATRPTYFKSLPKGDGFLWLFSNCVKLKIRSSLCCISKSSRSCFSSTTMLAFNLASVNHTANEIIYGSPSLVAKRLPMGHSQKLWNFLNLIKAKSRPKLMTIRQQISSEKSRVPPSTFWTLGKKANDTVISGIHFEASAWRLQSRSSFHFWNLFYANFTKSCWSRFLIFQIIPFSALKVIKSFTLRLSVKFLTWKNI